MATDGTTSTQAPATSAGLTDKELRTLKRALALFKASRADAKSKDPKIAAAAGHNMLSAFGYIVGFADGKRLFPAVNPGFGGVFQAAAPGDPDAILDAFQKNVEDLLSPTRAITPLGWAALAAGAILYGIGSYLNSTK